MKKPFFVFALAITVSVPAWAGFGDGNPWDGATTFSTVPISPHTKVSLSTIANEKGQPVVLGASVETHLASGGDASTGWQLSLSDVLGREVGAPPAFDAARFTLLPQQRRFLLRGAHFLQARSLETGKVLFNARIAARQSGLSSHLNDFALSPDKTRVALGGKAREGKRVSGRVRVFDVRSGQPLQAFSLSAPVLRVSWDSTSHLSAATPRGTQSFSAPIPPVTALITTARADLEAPRDAAVTRKTKRKAASHSRRTRARR